jgi:hypothetical protein
VGVCEAFKPLGELWHVSCSLPEPLPDLTPSTLDSLGQATFPLARSRDPTLLDVIQAVSEVAVRDQETLAMVADLLNSGQVRLCGESAGPRLISRRRRTWRRQERRRERSEHSAESKAETGVVAMPRGAARPQPSVETL